MDVVGSVISSSQIACLCLFVGGGANLSFGGGRLIVTRGGGFGTETSVGIALQMRLLRREVFMNIWSSK